MDIEERIKSSVLDQDHLADFIIGTESHAEEIRCRLQELVHKGLVELYTYAKEDQSPVVLDKAKALLIMSNPDSWAWTSKYGEKQLYFVAPVRLGNNSPIYGA